MFGKMVFVVLAGVACGLIACAGPDGKGEGDSCGSNDDCSSGLICQPITGHGEVCCPAPPDSSTKSSCQAESDGG
jgi:hypothetical protein